MLDRLLNSRNDFVKMLLKHKIQIFIYMIFDIPNIIKWFPPNLFMNLTSLPLHLLKLILNDQLHRPYRAQQNQNNMKKIIAYPLNTFQRPKGSCNTNNKT